MYCHFTSPVGETRAEYGMLSPSPKGHDIEVRLTIGQKCRLAMAPSEPATTLTPVRGLTVTRHNRMI